MFPTKLKDLIRFSAATFIGGILGAAAFFAGIGVSTIPIEFRSPVAVKEVKAGPLTDYVENKLIDHVFRGTAYSAPATLYVSLHTASCSDSSVGTEATGGSYARVAVTSNGTNWANTQASGTGVSSGTSGTTSNSGAITFPAPTANWGTVTHFGIFDASTSGNQILCQALTVSKTINNGDAAPSFSAGALTVQIDN